MSDYKAFNVEQIDKVAHVRLNRPDKANAMNEDVWRITCRHHINTATVTAPLNRRQNGLTALLNTTKRLVSLGW
jgi:hypothetical protein